MNQEPAGSGYPGDKLACGVRGPHSPARCEVGGPPCRQGAQCRRLGDGSILAAPVAAADELVDEAPVVVAAGCGVPAAPHVDGGEVVATPQDQRLIEGGLEMTVVGLDRTVLVRPDLEQGGRGCCGWR